MRLPAAAIDQLRTEGYTVVEGFVESDLLDEAREALWETFPRPDDYFADDRLQCPYRTGPWAGLRAGPCPSWALNRLAVHPDLIDLAERFLGSTDINLYKIELWAKYTGAADYEQAHHRDFGNHSLVVPRRRDPARQLTTFILLSDVSEADGPTKVVPLPVTPDQPYWPNELARGELTDREVSITGPAGTLFAYRTDVFHRGSAITGVRRGRFTLMADYQVWVDRWTGKIAWPDHALGASWTNLIERATPRQRALFGFPLPGDPYWDDQTRSDTQARYPNLDIAPYTAPASDGAR